MSLTLLSSSLLLTFNKWKIIDGLKIWKISLPLKLYNFLYLVVCWISQQPRERKPCLRYKEVWKAQEWLCIKWIHNHNQPPPPPSPVESVFKLCSFSSSSPHMWIRHISTAPNYKTSSWQVYMCMIGERSSSYYQIIID